MRLVLLTGLLTLMLATPAQAITNGEADNGRHPYAGALVAADWLRAGQKDVLCSGTLISPTVLITAAHCTEGTLGSTLVTFDSVIAEAPPSWIGTVELPSIGGKALCASAKVTSVAPSLSCAK